MAKRKAILIGSTGLIGSHLLKLLEEDSHFSEIKILVRRAVENKSPKVTVSVVDFNDTVAFKAEIKGGSVVFCTVGTTNKKVKGDETAYRKIDYDIPINAAKFSLEAGCKQFVYVSSVGADSNSNNFYTKLKGEAEDALEGLNFPSLSIFRPSMLMGKRNEFRIVETIGKVVMFPFSFLLPAKVKPIKASDVAKAMLASSKSNIKGNKKYHYKEILELTEK